MISEKKTLLILGASFAGLTALRMLHKLYNVILVDSKDFFEFTPSILECMLNPEKFHQIAFPIINLKDKYKFEFIHGILLEILENSARIQTRIINFDYCLICTGSQYNQPVKTNHTQITTYGDRFNELQQTWRNIQKAKDILVVGGGTVGVELAAELAFNQKAVTLVTKRGLLPSMPRRARQLSEIRLKQLGVLIRENQNLNEFNMREKFDLIFMCTGNSYQQIHMEQIQTIITKEPTCKQLKIDDYLRVIRDDNIAIENIFAAGDVSLSSLREEKTALSAELYAEKAANNLKIVLKPKNKKQLKKLFWIPKTYVISLGGKNAVLIVENISIGGYFACFVKFLIERTKMIQYKGNIIIELIWDIVHIILNIITFIFMLFGSIFGELPLNRKLQDKDKSELKGIQKEFEIKKPKQKL